MKHYLFNSDLSESNKMLRKSVYYQSGVTLVELMVALVIGLLVSLAIYNVMSLQEGRKRTTNSINDIDQSGAYGLYTLDKSIRSAGSGFSNASSTSYGCKLNASLSGTQVLPAGTLPAPFAAVLAAIGGSFRLAPVLIVNGVGQNSSDALITMNGTAGLGETSTSFTAIPAGSNLSVTNVASFTSNDRLALVDIAGITPCLIEQVASTFVPAAGVSTLPLSGSYYTASGADKNLAAYSALTTVVNLGEAPNFNIFIAGANNSLYSYDLLAPNATANANPILDGVYAMHAIYGVKLTPTSKLTWVDPASNASYSASTLMNGTSAATTALLTIKAVRLSLIMRTSLPEKDTAGVAVSPSTITIFSGTAAANAVALNPTNVRYRLVETTIPIRNALLQ